MQLGRKGSSQSFPFSTFPAELEERQGASPDAWLDPAKWGRFECELVAKVKTAASVQGKVFDGCFVGTAMNHRAALYTGIAEQPITAAAAARALRAALVQYRSQEGELFDKMMVNRQPGSSYPLARITAMHTFRLATVLELMFAPGAQFFFARDGNGGSGISVTARNKNGVGCEWTVGAFVGEARSLSSDT